MKATEQKKMHEDHVQWKSDMTMWQQDIRMWYQELEALRSALQSITKACNDHESGIDAHAHRIETFQNEIRQDELNLGMIEPSGLPDLGELKLHQEKARQHAKQKDAHERLKKYHHHVMVVTKNMKKALEGPM